MKYGSLEKKEELTEDIDIVKEENKFKINITTILVTALIIFLIGMNLYLLNDKVSQPLINNTINIAQPDINLNTQASNYNSTINNIYQLKNETIFYLNNYTNVTYLYHNNYTNFYANITNIYNITNYHYTINSSLFSTNGNMLGINNLNANTLLHVGNANYNGPAYVTVESASNRVAGYFWSSNGSRLWAMFKANDNSKDLIIYNVNLNSTVMTFKSNNDININNNLNINGNLSNNGINGITGNFNCTSYPNITISGGIITSILC